MPSIFLCHSSIDKSFVQQLANDLKRLGVNVWFDRYEIKVGDLLLWKVEEGIKSSDYMGVVLSPDAVTSQWVRHELASAMSKEQLSNRIVVLPILYRSCDLPLFLQSKRYADFSNNYDDGLNNLAGVFGISEAETISLDNWRRFAKLRIGGWQSCRDLEYALLIKTIVKQADKYKWAVQTGPASDPYSLLLSTCPDGSNLLTVAIRLTPITYSYMAVADCGYTISKIPKASYTEYVGNSVNEVEEFAVTLFEKAKAEKGIASRSPMHFLNKPFTDKNKYAAACGAVEQFYSILNWYNPEYDNN